MRLFRGTALLAAALFISMSMAAHAFNYQGRMTWEGSTYNGACSTMIFRLFDTPTGGTALGSITRDNVQIVDGLFSVDLDFGDNWQGEERWLEISLGCTGDLTLLSPRRRLAPVPYAQHAETVSRADNADFALWADEAGIAAQADSADFAANAGHAATAGHADTAGHATTADRVLNSNQSDTATTALFAHNAGTADTAQHATHATTADSADFASAADSATTATYALAAGTAAYAATTGNVEEADYAANAGTAVNALKLGGIDAANFLTTGPTSAQSGTMTYQVSGCPGAGCTTVALPVYSFEWSLGRPATIDSSGIVAGDFEFYDVLVSIAPNEHLPQMYQQAALATAQDFVFTFSDGAGGTFTLTAESAYLTEVSEQVPLSSPDERVKLTIVPTIMRVSHTNDVRVFSVNAQSGNASFNILPFSVSFYMLEEAGLSVTPAPFGNELTGFTTGIRNNTIITGSGGVGGVAQPRTIRLVRNGNADTINLLSTMPHGEGIESLSLRRYAEATPSRPQLYAEFQAQNAYAEKLTLRASAESGGVMEEETELIVTQCTWLSYTNTGTNSKSWNFTTNSQ